MSSTIVASPPINLDFPGLFICLQAGSLARHCKRSTSPLEKYLFQWAGKAIFDTLAESTEMAKAGSDLKTNAIRLLDQTGIDYELRQYEVDENDLSAICM
jgi:hypothetical protein